MAVMGDERGVQVWRTVSGEASATFILVHTVLSSYARNSLGRAAPPGARPLRKEAWCYLLKAPTALSGLSEILTPLTLQDPAALKWP